MDRFTDLQCHLGTCQQLEPSRARIGTINDPRMLPNQFFAGKAKVIGERLIDVDHAGLEFAIDQVQFAHQDRVVGLHDCRLEQFHAVFAAFAFGDVKLYAAQHGGRTGFVNHRDHITNPDLMPIFGDHAVLGLVIDPRFDRQSEICQRRLEVVRVNVFLPEGRVAGPFFGFVSEDAPHLWTDEGHAGLIGVGFPDDDIERIDQDRMAAFGPLECRMDTLLLGHIQERAA